MKLKNIILTLAVCATTTSATGAGFEALVDNIIDNSPGLKATRLRMEQEIETLKGENMLPDPEIEFERLWRSGEGDNRWSAGISQEIEWPGTYSARRKAITALTRAGEAAMSAAEIEERTKASQIIIGIIAARKEIAILDEIHSSMLSLESKLLTAWEKGEATILDVNKVKIEAIRSASRLHTAQMQLNSLQAELHAMTDGSMASIVPEGLDMPLYPLKDENVYLTALEASPQLESMRLAAQAANRQTALAKSSKWPGFTVGYNHAFEDGAHFNGFSIGLTLPLWSRKHIATAASNNAMATRFDMIARQTELKAKLHADYSGAASLYARMSQYGPLVEGVNNLTLLRKAFEGGELTLLNYLQEVNYFLEARLDYLSISKEYSLLATALQAWLPR